MDTGAAAEQSWWHTGHTGTHDTTIIRGTSHHDIMSYYTFLFVHFITTTVVAWQESTVSLFPASFSKIVATTRTLTRVSIQLS